MRTGKNDYCIPCIKRPGRLSSTTQTVFRKGVLTIYRHSEVADRLEILCLLRFNKSMALINRLVTTICSAVNEIQSG